MYTVFVLIKALCSFNPFVDKEVPWNFMEIISILESTHMPTVILYIIINKFANLNIH